MRFEISRRSPDSWVAQVVLDDGSVGLVGRASAEVERCVRSIEAIVGALRDAARIVRRDEDGAFGFALLGAQREALAESMPHPTAEAAAATLAALRRWASVESQFSVTLAHEPRARRQRAARPDGTGEPRAPRSRSPRRSAAAAPATYPLELVAAPGAPGFELVAASNRAIHFRFNAADGHARLLSREYASSRSCEAGVQAVLTAGIVRARYRVHAASERAYFSVRAANGRVIARSPELDRAGVEPAIAATMAELAASAPGSRVVTIPLPGPAVPPPTVVEPPAAPDRAEPAAARDHAAAPVAAARARWAHEVVRRHVVLAAGLGLVPIPWFDTLALAAVQVDMIEELAELHGAEFSSEYARTAVAALLAGVGSVSLTRTLARGLWRLVPGLGALLGAVGVSTLGGAVTWAIGRVFTAHFESGGTLLTFDVPRMRARFQAELDAGLRA